MGESDSIKAYRLRQDALEDYLKELFPDDDIEINKTEDDYEMTLPRQLTSAEKDHILDNLREDPDDF
ncbi:hypothetical protein E8E14_001019 [Neopestalotiopsis sp. 37M]|nr:hypothetical protein E8E14_001019 [Neopestalotiopsis sp. 37M]